MHHGITKPRSVTESNSHDAVVNLKSKTMNLKKLSKTFHEIFLLGCIARNALFSTRVHLYLRDDIKPEFQNNQRSNSSA